MFPLKLLKFYYLSHQSEITTDGSDIQIYPKMHPIFSSSFECLYNYLVIKVDFLSFIDFDFDFDIFFSVPSFLLLRFLFLSNMNMYIGHYTRGIMSGF